MPQVFISYRRVPSAMLAQLLAKELKQRGIDVYLDVRQTDGAGPFPERLLRAIDACDVFVCLVANSTFDSEWVRREIEHARSTGKRMIPVFQESYQSLPAYPTASIEAMLGYDGVHVFDVKNVLIDQSIDALARMIKGTEKPARKFPVLPALLSVITGFVLVGLAILFFQNRFQQPDVTATLNAILTQFAVETSTAGAFLPSETPHPSTTPTATDDLTATAQAQATLDAQATAHAPTNTSQPTETPIPSLTVDVGATRTATAEIAAAATQARLDAIATIRANNATAFANGYATGTQAAAETATHSILFAEDFSSSVQQPSSGGDPFTIERIEMGNLVLRVSQARHYTLYPFSGFDTENFYATAKVQITEQSREACFGYYVGSIGSNLYHLVMLCRDDFQFFARLTKYSDGQFTIISNRLVLSGWDTSTEFDLDLEADGGVYRLELNGEVLATTTFDPVRYELGFVVSNECCDQDIIDVQVDRVLIKSEK